MTTPFHEDALNRSVLFLNEVKQRFLSEPPLTTITKYLKTTSLKHHVSSMIFYIARNEGYFEFKKYGNGLAAWHCRVNKFEPFHAKIINQKLNLYNAQKKLHNKKVALKSAEKASFKKAEIAATPFIPFITTGEPQKQEPDRASLKWGDLYDLFDSLKRCGLSGEVNLPATKIVF
jgi:hypothetical protein